MDLSQLKPKVKNKKAKRVGRGTGSGKGKTSGRGNKGAGQRSGKVLPYSGFRGGNLSFLRRIPKRGFNNPRKKEYQIVNLKEIVNKLNEAKEIDKKMLKEKGLIKDENRLVKILGDFKGDFNLKAVFKVDKVSVRAKELIEKAGGRIENQKTEKPKNQKTEKVENQI